MILFAIFLPPLYYLAQKKVGMFLLTGAMFVLSFFLMLTVVFIPASLILWMVASMAALYHHRRQMVAKLMEDHARKVGAEVAASIRNQVGAQPSMPPRLETAS